MTYRLPLAALAFTITFFSGAQAQELREFSSKGLPGSEGMVLRVSHPAGWKRVAVDDDLALAELRGAQGRITGILQIGSGPQAPGVAASCTPDRARTLLQDPAEGEADARVTDVFARRHEGRPAYEIRYERNHPPDYLLVRSVVVCLPDRKVVVSCGATGSPRAALAEIEPVCGHVLGSLRISEE